MDPCPPTPTARLFSRLSYLCSGACFTLLSTIRASWKGFRNGTQTTLRTVLSRSCMAWSVFGARVLSICLTQFSSTHFIIQQWTQHKLPNFHLSFLAFLLRIWPTCLHILPFIGHVTNLPSFILHSWLWICSVVWVWRYWCHRGVICGWSVQLLYASQGYSQDL